MSKPFRLGVIGAGRWGKNYIKTISRLPEFELAYVVSSNPETKNLTPAGCTIISRWEDLLEQKKLDGVVISTPLSTHTELLSAFIKAGIPAIIEKPLAPSLPQARELQRLSESRESLVLVDHTYLFHPAYQRLKAEARKIGVPLRLVTEGGNEGPFRPDCSALWDYGTHDLYLCMDILESFHPEILSVQKEKGPHPEAENFQIALRFPGSVDAKIHVGNGFSSKKRLFSLFSGDHVLVFDDLSQTPLVKYQAANGEPVLKSAEILPAGKTVPLDILLGCFRTGVTTGEAEGFGLEMAVKVVELLERLDQFLPAQNASS